ncbi:UvrD-helicase domain-containing protein [Sphingomonas sp. SKA58]|uniref:UvrD-helicase domain-containing protein n=1 Tax=Sphingomonas sp. (strain SKA58) TaxID=314266 RepID=UPI0002E78459|nr:UvrD-helicase domain-containing protein [Sphingomonas sp. SKA58]
MTEIAIVPAGAGAGKTHHIKTTLGGWVKNGVVAPRRILAVTFTEAAASELRQRIRAELLAEGNIEAALEVEQAYVTTIHALGQRLLGEHALAHGASPRLRLIEEGEQDLLLRRSIEAVSEIGTISRNLAAHGYSYDYNSGASAEHVFRRRFLRLVEQLRTLGARGTDPSLAASAAQWVGDAYGPVSGRNEDTAERLLRSIDALLERFPRAIADSVTTKTARKDLRDNFKDLLATQRALKQGRHDWRAWQKLRNLWVSTTRTKAPEGYDELATAVIEAAEALPFLPGPRDDAMSHAEGLVRAAQRVMADYGRAKAEIGVIDYGDMVANAAKMLAERNEVTEAVLAEIDCVIIDEFQDTSPIQFAFLWQLARRAPRTLIVGDNKQAIMGFQGADPRLAEALSLQHPHAPLERNWRSTAPIMEFVNGLGQYLFGERYSSLAPTRTGGDGTALEVIEQMVSGRERGTKQNPNPAKPSHNVAERIADILDKNEMIIEDRHTGVRRPLAPRDIAVLCQTSRQCADYAEKLRVLGLPVRLAENGWWKSPVVQCAVFALSLVADPADAHAALCFASLGPERLDLGTGLTALTAGTAIPATGLEQLKALHDKARGLPADAVVAQVIAVAGLREWCEMLPDPLQMRADLARFEAEAAAFACAEPAPREAAGFYGNGIPVFLGWLEARATSQDDSRPHASGTETDGIEVVTWHSSKGREWPLVIVATMAHDRNPRAHEFRIEIPDFDDFDAILAKADLSYSADYAAEEALERALAQRSEEAREDCRRLLYVALTRARDRLVIEWPKPPKEWKEGNISPAQMLVEECGFAIGNGCITLGSTNFPARLTVGSDEIAAAFDGGFVAPAPIARAARHAVVQGVMPLAEAIVAPSSALSTHLPLPTKLLTSRLAPGIELANADLVLATDKGTALHEGLRICLQRPELFGKVAAHCQVSASEASAMAAQADALRSNLAARGFATLYVEQPLDVALADGTTQCVILDLLAQGRDGFMIVDHKSGPVPDHEARYATYWPQLAAYAGAVESMGAGKVTHAGVFWTHTGELTIGAL